MLKNFTSLKQFTDALTAYRSTKAPSKDFTSDVDSNDLVETTSTLPETARWQGPIVVEGTPTGDGRLLEHGSLTWDTSEDDPLLIRYVQEDVGAHDGAQVVGRIFNIERKDDGQIWAYGDFDLGSDVGREAYRQVAQKLTRGVSVDLDDVSFEVRVAKEVVESDQLKISDESPHISTDDLAEDDEGRVTVGQAASDEELFVTTSARIRAATLVATPAFADAKISITDAFDSHSEEVSGDPEENDAADAELDDEEEKIVLAIEEEQTEELDADDLEICESIERDEAEADDDDESEYRNWVSRVGGLPGYIRDIADALMRNGFTESRAIATAVNTVKRWARGGPAAKGGEGSVNADTIAKAAAAVASWEAKKDRASSATASAAPAKKRTAPLTRDALVAAAAPVTPPAHWFKNPKLSEPTALRVTDEGAVFGHVATWDTCHIAQPAGDGQCVTAPRSNTDYSYFHTGVVNTADGSEVTVGHITMDTGHAKPNASAYGAAGHYENTGAVVADVRAGEDAYGIWIAGALRPSVNEEQVRSLRSAPLSGDWRRVAGNLEMVAALAVNVPGFPIPRPHGMVASGDMSSLIAAGVVPMEEETALDLQLSASDMRQLRQMLDHARKQERTALAQRVKASKVAMAQRKVESFVKQRKKGA